MAEGNGNGNGNSVLKLWLPLWLFLLAQLGTGVWWAATVSSDVKYLSQEVKDVRQDYKILDLKVQRLQIEIEISKVNRKDGG